MTGIWLQGMALFCGLGAVVFAADAARGGVRLRWSALGIVGFVSMLAWSGSGRLPALSWIGLAVATLAFVGLARPSWRAFSGLVAGVMAAVLSSSLAASGIPMALALCIGGGLPLTSAASARRVGDFAPEPLVEDAKLMMVAFALILAAGPAVTDGWRTAGIINVSYEPAVNVSLPLAVWLSAGLSAIAGGAYALWWRIR